MSSEQETYQDYLEILKELQQNADNSSHLSEDSHPNNELLTKEQLQMYEMLGISLSSFKKDRNELINLESENEKSFEEMPRQDPEDEAILTSDDEAAVEDDDENAREVQPRRSNEYNNELVKKNEKELVQQVVSIYENHPGQSSNPNVIKRPFLKRGVGLTSRFGVSPEAFNLKNLPPYKYNERVKKTLGRSSNPVKATRRKSEPVMKVPEQKAEDAPVKHPQKTFEMRKSEPPTVKSQPKTVETAELIKVCNDQPITETPKNSMKISKSISWAQILSENNILSCPVDTAAGGNNESCGNLMNDTELFQILEHKINGNCSEDSVADLMELLAKYQNKSNEDDETLIEPEDPIIREVPAGKKELFPKPQDLEISQDDESSCYESGDDEGSQKVRFAPSVEVCDENTGVCDISTDLDAIELSQTSTPNERQKFDEFKKRLLGHKPNRNEHELQQKSTQMKGKLTELETEIETLRSQTAQIAKMRQDLELEKMQFESERDEHFQKIDDEKVKIEMFLHDERIKLENEKKKWEMSRKVATKKERDEIAKLKEQIESLTEESKIKDSRHAATTARYRSQTKQLEKENQSLKLELEVLKKENKKIEFENSRLRKDTNSKMLQEINRNIAKLAPPEQKTEKKSENKKPTTRRSEPAINKRTKSVPALNKIVSSSSESEVEEVEYKSRRSSKENNPIKLRQSDPPRHQSAGSKSKASDVLADMKREIVNSDGSKDIWYPNGNLKKISADGMLIRMLYFNKDIKETNINEGTVKYYYHDTNTWHTTYLDGLEILEYPDGQTEHRYKNGFVEVHYPNGSIRVTNSKWTDDTKEEWKLPDGTNIRILSNDTKILTFANGQREIHTPNNKRREYPDGTVKIAYADGSYETRYSNGRIRIKDGKGNLISDTVVN